MKLPQPKSQVQEVLYILLKHRTEGVTRFGFMRIAYVMNVPQAIRRLRNRGVRITTLQSKFRNKFGNKVTLGTYKLTDYEQAKKQYIAMCSDNPVTK